MNPPSLHLIRLLDELAANAWPGRTQQSLEGWRLRATDGVTRRANSVLTSAPVLTYAGWLEQVEEFYRRRQLPPRFQISDGSPEGLDALLEARGYHGEGMSMVQTASAQTVVEAAGTALASQVIASEELHEEWLDAFMDLEGVPQSWKVGYRAIDSAIGPHKRYVRTLAENGHVSAVGLAVTERGWTGLFSIATRPEYRGRGLATQVVRLIAEWSLSCDAPNLYLQVMEDNLVAVRLYEKLGFTRLYGYHYRTMFDI